MMTMRYISTDQVLDDTFHRHSIDDDTKGMILSFLKSKPCKWRAASALIDLVTGKPTGIQTIEAFADGDWCWETTDIYHFEKYNLALKPEFIEYALSQVA